MLNVLLVLLVPLFLVVFAARMARAFQQPDGSVPPLVPIMVFAYLIRVVAYYVAHNVQLFTHGIGGDWMAYQLWSEYIGAIWQREGIHMITAEELPVIGRTALPPNVFALVSYLNGDVAWEGCAALSALFAGVTGLNLFSLSFELGAPMKRALMVTVAFLFLPGFILYSAEMYKDSMVWALVFGVLASSVRLMTRLRARDVIIGVLCAWLLWYVRFYLVFLTVAPLAVGLFGLNTKNPVRTLLLLLAGMALIIPVLAYTKWLGDLTEQANTTFDQATGSVMRVNVAKGPGSGVVFDDGGTFYGALHTKLAYTLFAPFPWQGGSVGFHIGKIDSLTWSYFVWRAFKASRILLRTRPGLLFALLTFLVPTTLVYSFSVYNVGLILRQRMAVVIVGMLLASLSWPEEREAEAEAEAEAEEPEPPAEGDDFEPEAGEGVIASAGFDEARVEPS